MSDANHSEYDENVLRSLLRWPGCALVPAFVFLWYAVNGYKNGVIDHSLLTPMVQRVFDPDFLEGDHLFSTVHPTLIWYLYAPFVLSLGYEVGFVVMHALCLALVAFGVAGLASALRLSSRPLVVASYALAALLPLSDTFAAIETFDPLLIPRAVSLGPLLLALALAARAKFVWAFTVTGLVFNLHPTTAAHGAVLVGGIWLFSSPWSLRRCIEPLTFIAAAAPLLVLMAVTGGGGGVATPYSDMWLQTVTASWPFHHVPDRFEVGHYAASSAPWLLWLASRSAVRSRCADILMLSISVFCALGFLLYYVARVPQVIALHTFESTRFAHYVAPLLIGAWFVRAFDQRTWREALPGILAGLLYAAHFVINYGVYETKPLLVIPFAIAVLGAVQWGVLRRPPKSGAFPLRPRYAVPLIALIAALSVGLLRMQGKARAFSFRVDQSVMDSYREFRGDTKSSDERIRALSGLGLMRWAKENTPEDALIVMPPYMLHPLSSIRVVAKRKPFVTWKDGSEAVFSEAFAVLWRERIAAITQTDVLAPIAKQAIGWGDYYEPIERALDEYAKLPPSRFHHLREQYRATHVIRPADSPRLPFDIIYEDEGFVLYDIGD